MSRSDKIALGLTAAVAADAVAAFAAFATCLDESETCPAWHLWLDTVLVGALPFVFAAAFAAAIVAAVKHARHGQPPSNGAASSS